MQCCFFHWSWLTLTQSLLFFRNVFHPRNASFSLPWFSPMQCLFSVSYILHPRFFVSVNHFHDSIYSRMCLSITSAGFIAGQSDILHYWCLLFLCLKYKLKKISLIVIGETNRNYWSLEQYNLLPTNSHWLLIIPCQLDINTLMPLSDTQIRMTQCNKNKAIHFPLFKWIIVLCYLHLQRTQLSKLSEDKWSKERIKMVILRRDQLNCDLLNRYMMFFKEIQRELLTANFWKVKLSFFFFLLHNDMVCNWILCITML